MIRIGKFCLKSYAINYSTELMNYAFFFFFTLYELMMFVLFLYYMLSLYFSKELEGLGENLNQQNIKSEPNNMYKIRTKEFTRAVCSIIQQTWWNAP